MENCSWYLCWQRKTSLVLQTRWKDKRWLRSVPVKVNWSKSNLSYHLRYEHRLWSFELFSRTKNASLSFQTVTKQEAEGNTACIRTPQRRLKSEQKDAEPLIPAFPPLIRGRTFRAAFLNKCRVTMKQELPVRGDGRGGTADGAWT